MRTREDVYLVINKGQQIEKIFGVDLDSKSNLKKNTEVV